MKLNTMANILVPYKQDEEKWMQHYLKQAEKQFKPQEMMKEVKEKEVHPNYVSPASQLIAQAESELKRERKEIPAVFAPIKATPKFDTPISHNRTMKGSTSGKRMRSSPKQRNFPKQLKYRKVKIVDTTQSDSEDFFL